MAQELVKFLTSLSNWGIANLPDDTIDKFVIVMRRIAFSWKEGADKGQRDSIACLLPSEVSLAYFPQYSPVFESFVDGSYHDQAGETENSDNPLKDVSIAH